MTLWRVSINGTDPVDIEAATASGAAAQIETDWGRLSGERRQVETLVVHRAERTVLPAVKAMVLDSQSGWAGEPIKRDWTDEPAPNEPREVP